MNRCLKKQIALLGSLVALLNWPAQVEAQLSFNRMVTKLGEKLIENAVEDKKDNEVKLSIPKDEYVVYKLQDEEGMPAVAMVNVGLRGFEHKESFGWYCALFLDFEELAENGMPTSAESTLVFDWIEEVHVGLMGDVDHPNALFVGRMTNQGTVHAVWQVNNPEQAHKYVQGLVDAKKYPRKFEFYLDPDEEWIKAHRYLDIGLEE